MEIVINVYLLIDNIFFIFYFTPKESSLMHSKHTAMGIYASLIENELDRAAHQHYPVVHHDNFGDHPQMVPLWVELATLMLFVVGAIMWGARSRSNREIPE